MAAEAIVQCRVTPEMKTLLRALAAREQTTESALVRQLLEIVVRASAQTGFPRVEAIDKVNREARVSIRLPVEDRILLADRAAARGMPSATYVAALVRSHLRRVTPLPKDELRALKRCIAELAALGRNLNEVARAVHQGSPAALGREDLRALMKVCEGLRDHVRALIRANAESWQAGYAQANA